MLVEIKQIKTNHFVSLPLHVDVSIQDVMDFLVAPESF